MAKNCESDMQKNNVNENVEIRYTVKWKNCTNVQQENLEIRELGNRGIWK